MSTGGFGWHNTIEEPESLAFRYRKWSFVMLPAIVFLSLAIGADPQAYPRQELIIEPTALNERLTRVVVLDARPEKVYEAGHIPGAIRADVAALSKAFTTEVDAEAWAKRLGDLGIDVNSAVVIYGDDWRESARLWWILRYWGIDHARLLDGGIAAWNAAQLPMTTEPSAPVRIAGRVAPTNRLASREDVLKIIKDNSSQLLDARSSGEYCGEAGNAKRKGAIPGAVNLEWSQFVDIKTGKLKPASEISELFQKAGIDPAKPVVTYCQSGGRASVAAFVLELMGGEKVRNYYRSWSEWGNADDTPIVKPERK
jgi:thiosulfate/3-mercaptopyruvate sulfurtransferase